MSPPTSTPLPLIPWSKNPSFQHSDSLRATQAISLAAVDLLALGFPKQADKLLHATWEAGHILDFAPTAKFPLHRYWEVTNSYPKYLDRADEESVPIFFTGFILSKEDGLKQWRKFKSKKESRAWWPEHLRKNSGGFGAEDLEYALEHLDSGIGKEKHCSIGFAIDIAVEIGDEEKARELIEKDVTGVYEALRDLWDDDKIGYGELRKEMNERLGLHHSLHIWSLLEDGGVSKSLGVSEEAVEAYVEQGCKLIKDRLTKGVQSLYVGKSIQELVKIMDETIVKARRLDPEGQQFMLVVSEEELAKSSTRTTFLQPPATDQQIQALISKLAHRQDEDPEIAKTRPAIQLPDDYEEFLKITNGFLPSNNPSDPLAVFYSTSSIHRERADILPSLLTFILPCHHLPFPDFDYIPNPDPHVRGFDIGGGDDISIYLVEPSYVKLVVERYDAACTKADQRRRYVYDKLAVDTFGGIEKLREERWLVVVFDGSGSLPGLYSGFRDLLERWALPAAMDELRNAEALDRELKRKRGEEEKEGALWWSPST